MKRAYTILLFILLTSGLMACGKLPDGENMDSSSEEEFSADEIIHTGEPASSETFPDSIGIQFCTSHTAAIGQSIYVNTGMSICRYDEDTKETSVVLRQDGIRYLAGMESKLFFLGNQSEIADEDIDVLYVYDLNTGKLDIGMELEPDNYELLAWQNFLYILCEGNSDTSVTCYQIGTDGELQPIQDAPKIDRSIILSDLYGGELFDFLPEYAEMQGQWVIAYSKEMGGYYFHDLNSGKQIRPIVSALSIFDEDLEGMELLLATDINFTSDVLLPDEESAKKLIEWLREVPLVETAAYQPSDYYIFLRDIKGIPRQMCGISENHLVLSMLDYEIAANTPLPFLTDIAGNAEILEKISIEDILLSQYSVMDGGFTKEDIVYDENGCPIILVNSGVQPFFWDESKEYYSELWIIGEGTYFDRECGTTYRIVNALVYYDENGEEIGAKTSAGYYDYLSGELVNPENWW